MTQKRIRELDTYTQLDSGEAGYINPETIFFALDSVNFSEEPKKYSFDDIFSSVHTEKARLTGLSSRTVTVTFGSAFSSTPIGKEPDVYRMAQMSDGNYRRQNVKWGFTSSGGVSTTGFEIEIDSLESLTGIIIEYKYEEA